MDSMSPQQQQESLSRGGGQQENKRVRNFSLCILSFFELLDSLVYYCTVKEVDVQISPFLLIKLTFKPFAQKWNSASPRSCSILS